MSALCQKRTFTSITVKRFFSSRGSIKGKTGFQKKAPPLRVGLLRTIKLRTDPIKVTESNRNSGHHLPAYLYGHVGLRQ